MKHVGIVDITTLGTTLCQLALVKESQGQHPEYSVHSLPLALYLETLISNNCDWNRIANLILNSIACLKESGADFVIIPNNTGHYAYDLVAEQSPLPVLNMIELVAQECADRGIHNPAVLGTELTMANGLYNQAMSSQNIQTIIPNSSQRERLNQIIRQDLVPQQPKQSNIDAMAHQLSTLNCDAYVLACSELPTVLNKNNLGKPCIDPTAVLVQAALEFAQ